MSKYRASETTDYLRCPVLWDIRRNGVRPAKTRVVDVAAAIGTAIHAGAETWHRQAKDASYEPEVSSAVFTDGISAASKAWARALDEFTGLPFETDKAREMYDTAVDRIEKSLVVYWERWPWLAYDILDVERKLPAFGNTTLDLAVRRPDGKVAIIDLKTRRFSTAFYRRRFLDEYRLSWQLAHYVCGYSEEVNEEVTWFGLGVFDLTPKTPIFTLVWYPVDYGVLAGFRLSSAVAWDDMTEIDAGRRPLTMAAEHFDRYGPCAYIDWCFGDGKTNGNYITLKREKTNGDVCNDHGTLEGGSSVPAKGHDD